METIAKKEDVQLISHTKDFKLNPPQCSESLLSPSHSNSIEQVEVKVKICDSSVIEEKEMGSEEIMEKSNQKGGADKEKKFKKGPRPTPPPGLKDDLTTISHICVILFVGLILYACFSRPFDFFTWHPFLLSLGWMFLMTEGVLFISKENPVGRRLKLDRTLKLRYHWIAIVISMILVAIGFIIAVKTKNDRGKEHFKSLHAIFGLIAVLGCIPSAINGTTSLFDVELKQYIKPSLNTAIHVASGSVVVTFGGLSLIMSVYTNWFKRNTDNNKYLFMLGLVTAIYVTIWTSQRPWRKTLRKFFHIDI
ncbi:transmembrane reductase CYB561D2-like [Diorhabda carinulata]|uniref:transmembrane reductase CYB561D2-like n=1 Tax=Diorhabda carinulata TaxID=1163345 RepID=UPI0025A044B7|nr:transmembrane reductase CYB561D2-like [Diorhabda carinulata]